MTSKSRTQSDPPAEPQACSGASPLYAQLRAILSRYAGPITVDGLLASARARSRLEASGVGPGNVDRILHKLRTGVGVLCQPDAVRALLKELDPLVSAREAGK